MTATLSRTRRLTALLLHGPDGGPGPRERRATSEATPKWSWSSVVMHAPAPDEALLRRLAATDLVVCAGDATLRAVVAAGIPAVALTGPWPPPERWRTLTDELYTIVRG